MVQGVLGGRILLVRFQNGCEKNLSSNQLTVVIVDKIPVEEEPSVSTTPEIPEDQVEKEKGYYRCFYDLLQFKKEDGVNSKEEQAELENYHYEEETDDVNIDDDRERRWRNVFKGNEGGVDDKKALLHAKRWD